MTRPPAQLLLYRFGANAGFEGRLVGALERIESGGTLRVLDALFVRLDPETEELTAIDVHGRGRGGFVEPLLNFRLDPDTRRRATEQALASDAGATLSELAATLEPGTAIAAVLVEHSWAHALDDAVVRSGGTELGNEFVHATELRAELLSDLAARG